MSQRLLVVVATYNERENLPELVAALHGALPAANVLVIDDNSPDGTGAWCDQQATNDTYLRCHHRAGKQGLGSATLVGFRHAIAEQYDVVCTLDADFSHDPLDLPRLVTALEDADVAIGSRYCPGGAIVGWPLTRRVASRVMNTLSRVLLRLPARDTSGAFRAYRVAALERVDLAQVSSMGYSYLEEIVWLLARGGARFVEVPIVFRERRHGRSKAGLSELTGKLRMLWNLWRRS